MKSMLTAMMLLVLAASIPARADEALSMDFDAGVDGWRVVLDGVMGGRSSGRVSQPESGVLRFAGTLSLENNGGFSQIRTNVPGDRLADAEGVALRVRGDGRTYKFDVRCSNVRMMAGGFQQEFTTEAGTWIIVRLPFDDFRLYSFGRRVPDAPALQPGLIESVGVTLSDKNAGPFRLDIDSIATFGGDVAAAVPSGDDLASVAKAAGLDTLLKLVAAAELELPAGEPVTIFAPTDAAFAALPEATVRGLLRPEGRETLRSILTYHVATPALASADVLSRRSVATLNGQRLDVDASGPFTVGGAGLVTVDVPFDGGVVHVIDTVLMPESKSIVELAASSDRLGTLAAAVTAAGLGDQLGPENGPGTVFAPVDSAFGDLPPGALDALLERPNRPRLVKTLGLHVVPGRLYSADLLASRRVQTLSGDPIEFTVEHGRLRVGSATIIGVDIEAGNGVVHLIDAVLLPVVEPETISASASGEAARLCELAISRGVALFNAGQHAACAAIYEVTIEAMLALGGHDLGRDVADRLRMGLAEAETDDDWTDRAWTYRRALDDAYARLTRQAERSTATASQ